MAANPKNRLTALVFAVLWSAGFGIAIGIGEGSALVALAAFGICLANAPVGALLGYGIGKLWRANRRLRST